MKNGETQTYGGTESVSYTHLDVYKRQGYYYLRIIDEKMV